MKRCNSLTFSGSRGGLGGTNNPVDPCELCRLMVTIQQPFAALKVNPKFILIRLVSHFQDLLSNLEDRSPT